jgi:hypothetical protein
VKECGEGDKDMKNKRREEKKREGEVLALKNKN